MTYLFLRETEQNNKHRFPLIFMVMLHKATLKGFGEIFFYLQPLAVVLKDFLVFFLFCVQKILRNKGRVFAKS